MPKVWCAEIECVHCKENVCTAGEINLSAGHIHTKYQGRVHHWVCRTYEMSEDAARLLESIKAFYDSLGKEEC